MAKSKKHLEGRNKQQRKQVRKQLGTLKSLTIQPRTRVRYDKAKKRFYDFLDHNSYVQVQQSPPLFQFWKLYAVYGSGKVIQLVALSLLPLLINGGLCFHKLWLLWVSKNGSFDRTPSDGEVQPFGLGSMGPWTVSSYKEGGWLLKQLGLISMKV